MLLLPRVSRGAARRARYTTPLCAWQPKILKTVNFRKIITSRLVDNFSSKSLNVPEYLCTWICPSFRKIVGIGSEIPIRIM